MKTSKRILIGLIAIASLVLCVMSLLHVPWAREVSRWGLFAVFLFSGIVPIYTRRLGDEPKSTPETQTVAIIAGLGLLAWAYDEATKAPGVSDDYWTAGSYFLFALLAGLVLTQRSTKNPAQGA